VIMGTCVTCGRLNDWPDGTDRFECGCAPRAPNSVLGWCVVVGLLAVCFVAGYGVMATDDEPPPRPVDFPTATPAPNVSCVCACMEGAR